MRAKRRSVHSRCWAGSSRSRRSREKEKKALKIGKRPELRNCLRTRPWPGTKARADTQKRSPKHAAHPPKHADPANGPGPEHRPRPGTVVAPGQSRSAHSKHRPNRTRADSRENAYRARATCLFRRGALRVPEPVPSTQTQDATKHTRNREGNWLELGREYRAKEVPKKAEETAENDTERAGCLRGGGAAWRVGRWQT